MSADNIEPRAEIEISDTDPLHAHPLTARRLEKVEAMRARGEEPYPTRFERTARSLDVHNEFAELEAGQNTGKDVAVAGRVLNLRRLGKLIFVVLQDAWGTIQLFVERNTLGDEGFEAFEAVDAGDWIGCRGEVMTTRRGELSIRISGFELLSKALRPLPEKWHGLQDKERRYRQRYLDLIVNEDARRVATVRAGVLSELRRQFEARDFLEVETPMLQSMAGGALARPFVTHHNALDIDMYLRIATELHLKRLVVGGFERVFELSRVFRNEGIDAIHNPEFTTLEAYQALADYNDIMDLMEEIIPAVAAAATGGTVFEYQGRVVDLTPPYRRVALLDLVSEAAGEPVGLDWPPDRLHDLLGRHGVESQPGWGPGKMITELFEALVESSLWDPIFVIDFPKETSPLARVHRRDPNLTERFELFAANIELANAFTELNDPVDQRRRFEQQAKAKAEGDEDAHPIDDDYVKALEYGLPPTGGLGIGVDRLVMLLTDQATIREVVLFPTMRPE
ncbi:MAG: lysine--tRNA ligase [Acidimicrobiia bacterium]|nr:lysine--tRNA ligase [Acidimicrobiia bacterium]MDH5615614.1 lysine--tRNA ligase [Acidimicrobiia bacterium]